MVKHKYLSNFDCFSLWSNKFFGLLNCDYTPMAPLLWQIQVAIKITCLTFQKKSLDKLFQEASTSKFKTHNHLIFKSNIRTLEPSNEHNTSYKFKRFVTTKHQGFAVV
jgi:hypothetical protein